MDTLEALVDDRGLKSSGGPIYQLATEVHAMSLSDEIDAKRAEIHTDGYSMSIGELLNLYRDGELDIHPEFQRYFRWTPNQKTRLIESILLGIPIPSIFVSQRRDGVWDVIDGLQRLSTIFQFAGVLRQENGDLAEPLVLGSTDYLPSLDGKRWCDDDAASHDEYCLGRDHELLIKRAKIDVKIILKESDESSKYEMFQRLNTGGSPLTDQEVRNCVLITVNREFYAWIVSLAHHEHFIRATALTDRLIDEQYDVELVVRFLAFRTIPEAELSGIKDMGEFLTARIVTLAQSQQFDRNLEDAAFKFTFQSLDEALEDASFHRFDLNKGRFVGAFLISAFEVLALGIGGNYDGMAEELLVESVREKAQILWSDPAFTRRIGSGVSASSRVPVTIPLGRTLFKP
jgi:hypothetical protein